MHVWHETYLKPIEDAEVELEKQWTHLRSHETLEEHQQELQIVREKVVQLETWLQEWEHTCENFPQEDAIWTQIRQHRAIIHQYHVEMRKAILQSRRQATQRHHLQQRQSLMASADEAYIAEKRPSVDLMDALKRTTQLMTHEVDKSQQILKTLADSSHIALKTRDEYRGFTGILKETQRLLVSLWQRERIDRYLIIAALVVYGGVVLYIIKQRIIAVSEKRPMQDVRRFHSMMDDL
jgi:hypothetical protein